MIAWITRGVSDDDCLCYCEMKDLVHRIIESPRVENELSVKKAVIFPSINSPKTKPDMSNDCIVGILHVSTSHCYSSENT